MNRTVKSIIAFVTVSLLSVSAFANTASDNKIVAKVIKEKLGLSEAQAILDTPYDGFVEIRGKAKKDQFEFSKVKSKASFPDKRWEETAQSIVDQIDVPLSMATSSGRTKPTATAYVLFYKDGVEGVTTAGARQFNVTDGEGDYMALLVIRQKAPRGNVSIQNAGFHTAAKPSNKVYKFEVDA
jgi:hypothetical protein